MRSLLLALFLLRSYPNTARPWRYNLARFAVVNFYLYVAGVLALIALEDVLLFHPQTAASYWSQPPADLDPQDVQITSADGTQLHGWWSTPPYWTPEQGALLFFHGKGCNLSVLGQSA